MNILYFGDSNTWGYKPDKTGRFDENTRWTALLQKKLGTEYQVIRKARLNASQHFDLLIISPIHLGHGVGEPDFDPEFDEKSEAVSRNLADEYHKAALQNHAAFLNAADFASPSITDREHMDESGHAALAEAVYDKIIALGKGLANVI